MKLQQLCKSNNAIHAIYLRATEHMPATHENMKTSNAPPDLKSLKLQFNLDLIFANLF